VKSVGYQDSPSVPEPGLPQFWSAGSTSEDQRVVASVRRRLMMRRSALFSVRDETGDGKEPYSIVKLLIPPKTQQLYQFLFFLVRGCIYTSANNPSPSGFVGTPLYTPASATRLAFLLSLNAIKPQSQNLNHLLLLPSDLLPIEPRSTSSCPSSNVSKEI